MFLYSGKTSVKEEIWYNGPMTTNEISLAKTYDKCKTKEPNLTVVLIHGIASDSRDYAKGLEHFENDSSLDEVRFVTFDLLGSGKSLKDDERLNYDYEDQIGALNNAIDELDVKTPLILVGHSLGTFIVTRFAATYPKKVNELVLLSPPIFTKKDFDNPALMAGIEAFKKIVGTKFPGILKEKSFNNSMEKIVFDKENYDVLTILSIPTTLIYGEGDQLIASFNIPGVLKKNAKISAIKTEGRHSITHDKYEKLADILEESLKGAKK